MFLLALSALSWGASSQPIGSISAIEGEAWLTHRGDKASYPAMLGDSIYLVDLIQTEKDSRVQILFQDESLLNLAENTTIQIIEHIYSPEENRRSVVIRVPMGSVRGVVGRYFGGPGSMYLISTPTDTIAVEHGRFVVNATAGRIQLSCPKANILLEMKPLRQIPVQRIEFRKDLKTCLNSHLKSRP